MSRREFRCTSPKPYSDGVTPCDKPCEAYQTTCAECRAREAMFARWFAREQRNAQADADFEN